MSEWHVTGEKLINDDKGFFVCEVDDVSIARQIVREHNVIPEMVSLLKEYRENRQEMFSMSSGWPELQHGKYQKQIDRIDAMLARAEGRTE